MGIYKITTLCLTGALCFSMGGIRAEASNSFSFGEEGIASVMTEAHTADPTVEEKIVEELTPSEFEGICIAQVND